MSTPYTCPICQGWSMARADYADIEPHYLAHLNTHSID